MTAKTRTFFIGERVQKGEAGERRTGRIIVASGDKLTVAWDDGGQSRVSSLLLDLAPVS